MPTNFRLATFNCENLFGRPKIFGENKTKSMTLLDDVKLLQDELTKTVFDHTAIKAIKDRLKGYAKVNDIRGKHTSATGVDDWFGWIELSRQAPNDASVLNTARVIADVDADVICVVEVEDRPSLKRFHSQLLNPKFLRPNKEEYKHIMLIDGNDSRGIDVAILSRHPIDWIRSHIDDITIYFGNQTKCFSRDCLEAKIKLPNNMELHLLVNHLKSLGYNSGRDSMGNTRRLGQTQRIAQILSNHNLDTELIAVVGDLNAPSDNTSLQPLLGNPKLYNVNLNLPQDQRGTYKTSKKQLDYILISEALKAKLTNVRIERQGVFTTTSKWTPYPTVVSRRTEASDHAVVVADFTL